MFFEEGTRFRDIPPFSKTFAPPCIVFGYWVILRKIEAYRSYRSLKVYILHLVLGSFASHLGRVVFLELLLCLEGLVCELLSDSY